MSELTPGAGKVVLIHYTLTDEAGQVLDSTDGDEPMAYLHGAGNIVPGLEKALEGRRVGDRLRVKVPPEAGYGLRRGPGPQVLPREALPAEIEPAPGLQLVAHDEQDRAIPIWILQVEGDNVVIDADHPLAGVVLLYDAQVVAVREATKAEREHGHPHAS